MFSIWQFTRAHPLDKKSGYKEIRRNEIISERKFLSIKFTADMFLRSRVRGGANKFDFLLTFTLPARSLRLNLHRRNNNETQYLDENIIIEKTFLCKASVSECF